MALSISRTGTACKELHEWIEGKNEGLKVCAERHLKSNIPKFFPVVKKKFGNDCAEEYVTHLEDDYNSPTGFFIKIYEFVKNVKKNNRN